MIFALVAALAFFIGSVPFGLIIARRKGIDLLKFGSGNIGATNAMRALGTTWGLVVFGLDVLKGVVPTLIGRALLPQTLWGLDQQPLLMLAGTFAILGHCFSPWLRFKGGKGISTILGVGLGAIPLCALISFGVMLILLALTRYVSLASMVGVATSLFWNRVLGDSPQMLPVLALLTAFIVYRHRMNIRRLISGTETKFTGRRSSDAPSPTESEETLGEPGDIPEAKDEDRPAEART